MLQLWIRDCPVWWHLNRRFAALLVSRPSQFGVASLYITSIGGQPLLPVTLPEVEVLTLGVAGKFVLLRTDTDAGSLE